MNSPTTAILLAGGRSRRMGVDKSQLKCRGETFAARAVETLLTHFSEVVVVSGDPSPFLDLPVVVVPDAPGHADPMGAVLTGWGHAEPHAVFVTAVDMPGLNSGVIERLLIAAHGDASAAIIAPEGVRGFEPLHALYRPASIPVMRRRHAEGARSFQRLADELPMKWVSRESLGAGEWSFRSVNTPADLARWNEFIAQ